MKMDGVTSMEEIIFLLVFSVLIFLVPVSVVRATYDDKSKLDLRDLWTNDQGKLDKFSIIIMFTWWVHTSSMILWTLLRTILTADYLTYSGVWATPIIARMLMKTFGPTEPPKP